MADPNIPNVPASFAPDQAMFAQAVKGCIDILMGYGRNSESNRALRVSEYESGLSVLNETIESISLEVPGASSATPDAPANLVVVKGMWAHHLSWDTPTDANNLISHIEIWAAIDSQDRDDALLRGIVTVTPEMRGETGHFTFSAFDGTSDVTYWIRSISYANNHSEWAPPDAQGGYVVPGEESIGEIIDGIMLALDGGSPEDYDPERPYLVNEQCRTSDGRAWKSIYAGENIGHEPPNATYWERSGILLQGDIDGVPTIGVDGNLVVDGTILARHIKSDEIFTMKLVVGAGSSGLENFEEYASLVGGDGQLTVWYYDYVPTTSNIPYTDWDDDTERDLHVGDLFFNTVTNQPYRFKKVAGVYSWESLKDPEIATALESAENAQDTADNKRRVFTAQPIGPYDGTYQGGDLWAQDGVIKKAVVSRGSGEFYTSDWVLVGDVTGENTANDVLYVDSVLASIVRSNAAAGATFTSSHAKALAYLDIVEAAHFGSTIVDSNGYLRTGLLHADVLLVGDIGDMAYKDAVANSDITSISGGKISTGIITSYSGNLKFNLDNNLLEMTNASAEIRFGSNQDIKLTGSTNNIRMEHGSTGRYTHMEVSTAGFKSYCQVGTSGSSSLESDGYEIDLTSSGSINIQAGSSSFVQLKAAGYTFYHDGYSFRPGVAGANYWLGTDSCHWHSVYAYRYLTSNGWIYDTEDDLTILANVLPKRDSDGAAKICPNNGKELLSVASLPDYLTNKEELRAAVKSENGDMISNDDFEEFILDDDELGWRLMRDIAGFVDLTSGAVRQLNEEITSEIVEQFNGLIEDLTTRITKLETSTAAVKESV